MSEIVGRCDHCANPIDEHEDHEQIRVRKMDGRVVGVRVCAGCYDEFFRVEDAGALGAQ